MGRCITRYWLSTGIIEPEFHLESLEEQRQALPIAGRSIDTSGTGLTSRGDLLNLAVDRMV